MVYQGFTNEEGKLDILLELTGQVINRTANLFLSQLQDAIHILWHIKLTLCESTSFVVHVQAQVQAQSAVQ
jgi:hypothetical protein